MFSAGAHPLRTEYQNLSRLQIPLKGSAYSLQRTAFRGRHIHAIRRFSIAQGTEAIGVPGTDQLLRGHQNQRIRTIKRIHGGAESVLNGRCPQPFPGHDVGNGLRVTGGMENRSGQFQSGTEFRRIAQISVVGQRHFPLLMIDLDGLTIVPVVSACGSVADMSHRHVSPGQPGQSICGKHLADQSQILVGRKYAVVVYHNTAALLAPVLQSI